MTLALFGSLGTTEILIIAGLILVLLVTGQLPWVARSAGSVLRQVRGVRREIDNAKSDAIDRFLGDGEDRGKDSRRRKRD